MEDPQNVWFIVYNEKSSYNWMTGGTPHFVGNLPLLPLSHLQLVLNWLLLAEGPLMAGMVGRKPSKKPLTSHTFSRGFPLQLGN